MFQKFISEMLNVLEYYMFFTKYGSESVVVAIWFHNARLESRSGAAIRFLVEV